MSTTPIPLGGITYPPGNCYDLIYSSNPLAASVLGSNSWTGPSGFAPLLSCDTFDFRPYSYVHITLGATAVTGGTTPTIGILVIVFDGPELSPTAIAGAQFTATQTIPAAGGGIDVQFGAPPPGVGIGGSWNQTPAVVPTRVKFCRIGISASGAPTGITNGRLFVWGGR